MRLFCLATLLLSLNSAAYPVIVKLQNNRNNALILSSAKHHCEKKIDPEKTLEFIVFSPDDWRIQYATGVSSGLVWKVDEGLGEVIERCTGKKQSSLIVCELLVEKTQGSFKNTYNVKNALVIGNNHQVSANAADLCLKHFFVIEGGLVTEGQGPQLIGRLAVNYRRFCQRFGYAASGRLHLIEEEEGMQSPFSSQPDQEAITDPLISHSNLLSAWVNEMDRIAPPQHSAPPEERRMLDKVSDVLDRFFSRFEK